MGSFSVWHWLIVAVLGFWIWSRFGSGGGTKKQASRPDSRASAPPVPVFDWPASGDFDGEVVGESNYQPALRALAGSHGDAAADAEHWAVLVPEDGNRYDSNAVWVEIGGRLVGYLGRDDAREFRDALRAKGLSGATRCRALVMGGFVLPTGARASYGVRLDLEAIT